MDSRFALFILTILACGHISAQSVTGELRQWHDVALTFDEPATSESAEPNPFLYYRLNVTFTKGDKRLLVPGYFAADGDAAETSGKSGIKSRVHFVPDEVGDWDYAVSFHSGPDVAVSLDPGAGTPMKPDGVTGHLRIAPTNDFDEESIIPVLR